MATLSGNKIKDTYQSLVKFSDNGNITTSAKQLTDGFGNNSPMYVSTTQVGIGVTPESGLNLHVYGDAKIGSNLTIIGNLVVEGSTTTVGTDTLTVKDPLIVLANNNTSTDAVDIGFYGKYTPSGTTLYSGLFREALTGKYRLFKDLQVEPTTTVNTSGTGYTKADLVIGNLETTQVDLQDNQKIRIGVSQDLEIYHNATNSFIDNDTGSLYIRNNAIDESINIQCDANGSLANYITAEGLTGEVTLYWNGSTKLVTKSNGIAVTGIISNLTDPSAAQDAATKNYVDTQISANNELSEVLANGNTSGANDIIMADSQKVNYGTGSDLQIYHDATDSYIKNDTGNLIIEQTTDDADIIFKNDNGSGDTIEYFRIDGSESRVVYGRSIHMADNVSIFLGNDDDGLIRYDSTANKILYTGTSQFSNDLTVVGDAVFNGTINLDDDEALNFGTSNAFNLRWSTTAASGQGASIIDSNRIFIETNFFQLNSRTGESMIRATGNSDVELYYDNSKKLETTSTGVSVTGNINLGDNNKILLGDGDDVEMYFDGATQFGIINDTGGGSIFLRSDSFLFRNDTNQFYSMSTTTHELKSSGTTRLNVNANGITVSGIIKSNTGSASAPAYSFDADGDIGMYRSASDELSFSTAGTKRVSIDSSGETNFLGNINIIGNGTIPRLTLENNVGEGGLTYYLTSTDNGIFGIYRGSTDVLTIDSNGDVGIGTDSAQTKLHLQDEDNALFFTLESSNTTTHKNVAIKYQNYSTGNNFWWAGLDGAGSDNASFSFKYNQNFLNEILTLDTSGNIGIGTNSPASKLVVRTSTDHNFEVEETGGELRLSALNDARSANIGLQFAASEFNFITGNVGIGTTSPTRQLHLKRTSGDVRGIMVETTVATSYAEVQVKAASEFRIGTGGSSTTPNGQFYVYDATAGAHRFDIDANGNVGIGTISPYDSAWGSNSKQLTISGGTYGVLNLIDAGGPTRFGIGAGDGKLYLAYDDVAGAHRIVVSSSGNVGIGTTSPVVPFHIVGTAVDNPSNGNGGYEVMQIFDDTSYATGVGGGIGFGGKFNSSGTDTIFSEIRGIKENSTDSNYAGALTFSTRANGANITERMRIDSSGNVGIGTTSPAKKLEVATTGINQSSTIRIQGTDGNGDGHPLDLKMDGATDSFSILIGQGGGATPSTILLNGNRNGNVGIGTTSPARKFHVSNAANGNIALFTNTVDADLNINLTSGVTMLAPSTGIIALGTSNTERMRIDSFGQTKFLNRVEIQAADTGTNPSSGTTARLIIDNNSNTNGCIAVMDFRNYSTFVTARIGAQFQDADDKKTDLYFMTRANGGTLDERMRIESDGTVRVKTGSIVVDTAGEGIYLGGTAVANNLDDYEEGTWTPTNQGSSGLSTDPTSLSGRYTKIGRQVTVSFALAGYSCGTGIKSIVIGGFPFIQHSAAHTETGYCSTYPHSNRRSGIVIDNSGGDSNNWFVSFNIDTAASNRTIRGTVIYTTT